MKTFLILILIVPFLIACGNNSGDNTPGDADDTKSSTPGGETNDSVVEDDPTPISDDVSTSLGIVESRALSSAFCSNQNKLQLLSSSLLSAYSVLGNGSDLNYCGGSAELNEDGMGNFDIAIKDYCVDARGSQVTLNGNIKGSVESGANFISTITDLSVKGENVDLLINGRSWDGRADDMFVELTIADQILETSTKIDDISIKNGEFDFGYITFDGLPRYSFKVIDYFDSELTEGLLYFYGEEDVRLGLFGENQQITVVLTQNRQDPGTVIESSCSK